LSLNIKLVILVFIYLVGKKFMIFEIIVH
jgi:hypothetical protein